MKILLIGDSITDMCRNREADFHPSSYGVGYPIFIEGQLAKDYPNQHHVINKGISGNRVVDVYARIKIDCWNHNPDVVSILLGVNDVWHEVDGNNGVSIDRFEKVYRMLLQDTKKALPNAKIIVMEPFILKGEAVEKVWDGMLEVKEYAKVVKKLAQEENCLFLPLQETMDQVSDQHGIAYCLYDGVHPSIVGGKIIAEKWLELFNAEIAK